jgi:hypothetical protein
VCGGESEVLLYSARASSYETRSSWGGEGEVRKEVPKKDILGLEIRMFGCDPVIVVFASFGSFITEDDDNGDEKKPDNFLPSSIIILLFSFCFGDNNNNPPSSLLILLPLLLSLLLLFIRNNRGE